MDDRTKKSPERAVRRFVRGCVAGHLPNLRLVSPIGMDSDQELNDLEVASVLADHSSVDQLCISPTKTKPRETPFRPTTVMTNLQRGNVQTTTPVTIMKNISMHQMAAQGELMLLTQEIQEGADVNKGDNSGMTALLWACAYGQLPTVEYLVENGADLEVVGSHGENAVLLAASNGHLQILEYLLALGMDVNYSDETGSTALMYASFKNFPACVQILLEHGADMTLENEDFYTALDLAVGKCNRAVQQTLEKYMLSLLEK